MELPLIHFNILIYKTRLDKLGTTHLRDSKCLETYLDFPTI